MLSFFKGFQRQNIFIMFLFSMKNSYLLTTKTIPDVNALMQKVPKWSDTLY